MRYAVLVLALLVATLATAQTPLHPKYECSGTTTTGKRYQLTLVLSEKAGAIEMSWFSGQTLAFTGFGVRKGAHVAALFADGKQVSVILYDVMPGQLIGWSPGPNELMREVCLAGKPA